MPTLTTVEKERLESVALRLGKKRKGSVVSYTPANHILTSANLQDCSATDTGPVYFTFEAWQSMSSRGRIYFCDQDRIFPYMDFKDRKVFSIFVNKENVRSFVKFLQDRDDYRSAKKLKNMFPEYFPVSRGRKLLRQLLRRA